MDKRILLSLIDLLRSLADYDYRRIEYDKFIFLADCYRADKETLLEIKDVLFKLVTEDL